MIHWDRFFQSGANVIALPSWAQPRLFVNAETWQTRWLGSDLYPASRWYARAFRHFLRTKALLGLGEIHRANVDFKLDEFLTRAGYSGWTTWSVLVGTEGPTQKVILELRTTQGLVAAYLKYGSSQVSRKRIAQEHAVLSTLPKDLAPFPLYFGDFNGGVGLLLAPVLGKRLPIRSGLPGHVVQYARSLPVFDEQRGDTHPWLSRFLTTDIPLIVAAVESLASRTWTVLPQHGDFAPWNIIERKGLIIPIDWEYGTLKGFPGADLAYYLLQVAALIYRWSPHKAHKYASRLLTKIEWLGLDLREAKALTILSSYDAYTKALDDGVARNSYLQIWRQKMWK